MNEEKHNLPIEPDLEARIVALVLGEASDFETEELERLIKSRPELAAFKHEMEQVSSLLREVGASEEMPGSDWGLPSERRQVVLDAIQGKVATAAKDASEAVASEASRFQWRWMGVLEGVVAIAIVFVLIGLMLPAVQMSRESAHRLAKSEADANESGLTKSGDISPSSERVADGVTSGAIALPDGFGGGFDGREPEVSKIETRRDATSALSLIEDSLAIQPAPIDSASVESRFADMPRLNLPSLNLSERAAAADPTAPPTPNQPLAGFASKPNAPESPDVMGGAPLWGGGVGGVVDGQGQVAGQSTGEELKDQPLNGRKELEQFKQAEQGQIAAGKPQSRASGSDMGRPVVSKSEAYAFPDETVEYDFAGRTLEGAVGQDRLAQNESLRKESDRVPSYEEQKKNAIEQKPVEEIASQFQDEAEAMNGRIGDGKERQLKGEGKSSKFSGDVAGEHSLREAEGRGEAQGRYDDKNRSSVAGREGATELEKDVAKTKATLEREAGRRASALGRAPSMTPPAGLNETNATAEAFSTFSLHVSDVSFKLALDALARGQWPEAAKIRIEEFVNAFDYGDPLPCSNDKVACVVEQAIHPFIQQRNILRVSMRTSAEGRAQSTPLRLTLVLDNSGSMERIDRQQAVRRALSLLAQQLSPHDQVTLISFARQPRLLAENVSGANAGQLVELLGQLPSEGGTNIEAALKLAFEKANSQQATGEQNRIVLLTDGAVNLGNANPESLSKMVESMRAAGIAFDAAGISAEGLNDEVLEALTRKGDGRYYLLDGEESSGGRFAQQIAGALRPSASNVKVQVEFNPKRVGQYKLLGFEKHLLQQEDFRNDAVDAAELAAAEAGVAIYQVEAKPDGEGDVGSVSVRFRDLESGQMVERRWPIPYEPNAARPDQAAASLRLATVAAMLAARLRGEALGDTVDLKTLSDLVAGLPEQQQQNPRVQELKLMIEQARQLSP